MCALLAIDVVMSVVLSYPSTLCVNLGVSVYQLHTCAQCHVVAPYASVQSLNHAPIHLHMLSIHGSCVSNASSNIS